MTTLRDMPVGRKFALIIMISTTAAVLLMAGAFIVYDYVGSQRDAFRHLSTLSQIVANNSTAAVAFQDRDTAAEVLAALQAEPGIETACTYDADRNFMAEYRRPGAVSCPPTLASSPGGRLVRDKAVFVEPVVLRQLPRGFVYLRFNLEQVRLRRNRFLLITLAILLPSLLAGWLLGVVLKRYIVTPISELAAVMARVSASRDYAARAAPRGADELGQLVGGFNRMLEQIEDSQNRLAEQLRAREAMNRELAQARDAAEAGSRAKSEFLANMSHELRTPLNGIMGMTELAMDTELTSEQREYLVTVQVSADALLNVINDILDFSKIEAGKLDFESIEFDFRGHLEIILKSLAVAADRKGLELNCRIAPEVPQIVVGDPSRLRQILLNLVGNAIKFTERGEVTVDAAAETEALGDLLVHCRVSDTGIGIPPEKQSLIFEAFTQADGSMTRRYGGSGLGLTITRQLVERFGGRIWLESVPGRGTTFHFTVRLGGGSQAGLMPPLAPDQLQDVRVLVVDDNLTNRRILEEVLARWSMRPTLADSAPAALQQLREAARAGKPVPLLLVDCKMPGVDGFTLIEQLKQDPLLSPAAIMMLTSGGQRGDAARCRQLGIAAYLTKPIGQAELLQAVLQVLGAHAAVPGQPAPLVTRHSLREHRTGLRILLAEDNPVNRMLAVRLLEKQGHNVEVAQDGHEALAKIRAGAFDLALMDVQMPGLDGFQATAAIREQEHARGGGHLPIIAMTAYALKGDRERCLVAGMDGYIGKPFRVEDVLKEIDSLSQHAAVK